MNDQEWEGEMSTEFDRRVRDLHEAPLTIDQVRGRAVTIQRRRRAVVAGSVLAAAAVIVPVAVAASDGLGDTESRRVPAATSTPTATDSSTPDAPVDPGALGVGYLEGRTYHRADGTAVELPGAYQDAAAIDDVVLAGGFDESSAAYVVDVVDAGGEVIDSFETLSAPVSDRAEEVVAYVDAGGDLLAVWASGETVLAAGLTEDTRVVAVTGGPTCEPTSDCRIWLDDGTRPDGLRWIGADGEETPVPGDVLALQDVTEDGVAAVTTSVAEDQQGSCGGLYDVDAARLLVDSCEYTFLGASPSGDHADTTHPALDGFGNAWAAIVDRQGREVARFEESGTAVVDQVWQDDEHLLVATFSYDAQEWAVVRLGVDGTQEVVAGPVAGTDVDYYYRFG